MATALPVVDHQGPYDETKRRNMPKVSAQARRVQSTSVYVPKRAREVLGRQVTRIEGQDRHSS